MKDHKLTDLANFCDEQIQKMEKVRAEIKAVPNYRALSYEIFDNEMVVDYIEEKQEREVEELVVDKDELIDYLEVMEQEFCEQYMEDDVEDLGDVDEPFYRNVKFLNRNELWEDFNINSRKRSFIDMVSSFIDAKLNSTK